MSFKTTTAVNKLLKMFLEGKRTMGVPGGTSGGKTFGILPVYIQVASQNPGREISVMAESVPHLKKGAMKDFKTIMQQTNRWIDSNWNATDSKYTFENGAFIEFFSADSPTKVHGPRRDDLYVNEANAKAITWEIYYAAAIRTRKTIMLDFNPTNEFWYHEHIVGDRDWTETKLTYKDNEALDDGLVREIEKARERAYYDPNGDISKPSNIKSGYWDNWWKVYGLGLTGSLEGQIFDDIEHVHDFPEGRAVFGLDWGYSSDPTALVKCKKHRGKLYRKQLFFKKLFENGVTQDEKGVKILVDAMLRAGIDEQDPILVDNDKVAAHALSKEGFNVYIVDKPPGSKVAGINALKNIPICTTYDSLDLIEEERKYFWELKDGKPTNNPIDKWDHGWDATRYAYDYIQNPLKKHYLSQRKGKRSRRKVYTA